ncbi:MAG: protein-export chaperone SecB [Alphaproteobacteria bacterium]
MSESSAAALNGGSHASAASAIVINAQYVRDMSFENPNAPAIFMGGGVEPKLEVAVNVAARGMGDRVHEVIVTLKAESKFGERTGFIAELSYAGLFSVPAMPEQQLRNLLLVECPYQLFPFARAVLSDMVREGNFPPLLLAPIDFAALYRQNMEQQAQQPRPDGGL